MPQYLRSMFNILHSFSLQLQSQRYVLPSLKPTCLIACVFTVVGGGGGGSVLVRELRFGFDKSVLREAETEWSSVTGAVTTFLDGTLTA